MARYGMDYGRDFDRWGRGERYEGWGGYGARGGGGQGEPPYGGMRSDGWGSNARDFPGEEGWYGGGGYESFPGGFRGGYDAGYGGSGFGGGYRDQGGRGGSFGGMGRGYGSDYGMDAYSGGGGYSGGGYPEGGFGGGYGGGGGYAGGGYGGGYGGAQGGYGGGYGGGLGQGGYAGRDTGYGTGMVGDRGGWGRGEQRMRAADLMTENPECVTPDSTLADVAKRMRDLDVGIIPVVDTIENRRLQGVITDRDIAVRAIAEGKDGKARVSDFMTRDVETCNKNDGVEQVLELMRSEQVRRVPITDREGRLVGIIAQADLAVEYGGFDQERELRVEQTIERISEPARPERPGRAAARGRSGSDSGMSGQGRGSQSAPDSEGGQSGGGKSK